MPSTKSDRKAEVIANHGVEEWERRKALNNARNRKMNATPRMKEKASIRYENITPEQVERDAATALIWRKTPAGKKSQITGNWNWRGLTPPEGMTLSELYDNIYLPATNCGHCNSEFKNSRDRHADHDHNKIENNFRLILCHDCNVSALFRK